MPANSPAPSDAAEIARAALSDAFVLGTLDEANPHLITIGRAEDGAFLYLGDDEPGSPGEVYADEECGSRLLTIQVRERALASAVLSLQAEVERMRAALQGWREIARQAEPNLTMLSLREIDAALRSPAAEVKDA